MGKVKSLAVEGKVLRTFRWRDFSIRNKLLISFGVAMLLMLLILLGTGGRP